MGAANNIQAVQTVFLLLLVMVAASTLAARKLRMPYPIVLVVAGLAMSFVPHMPRVPLDPELVFLVFLPPLLFAAAWQTSWREFRYHLVSIGMLAVGLVAFTVWGMAEFTDFFIPMLDWKAGFVLGAVVATTDAIAAASIAKQVGLPKAIVDILEGESLVNDATGLLALEFGLMILVQGRTPTVGEGFLRLLWLIGAGLGVGLTIAVLVTWIERHVDDEGPIEIVISLVVPYSAYLAGEWVHGSGVLSVVACGLYLSRQSAFFFSPGARIQVWSVWEAMNFALNGIVFAMIGLQLPTVLAGIREYTLSTLLLYGLGTSAALIALRMLWMFPASQIAYLVRRRLLRQRYKRPKTPGILVLGWSGMRGVIALAAAFSLPAKMAERNLIIFLTFCVILVTLLVQGLTLPFLVRLLGLAGVADASKEEELMARESLLAAAIAHLYARKEGASKELAHGYEDLLHNYQHRLDSLCVAPDEEAQADQLRQAAREAVSVERRVLIRLRAEERIGDEVLRKLERELDLSESWHKQRTA